MDRFVVKTRNTSEQTAIVAHPYVGGELVLVEAVAGSGKTHTIVSRALHHSTPTSRSLMLAFNTAAQKHLLKKITAARSQHIVKTKTTTVYARAWDNKVRMDRLGFAKAWAPLHVVAAVVQDRYEEDKNRTLLNKLQILRRGAKFRGGIHCRLTAVVRKLSRAGKPITPSLAGWSITEMQRQWLWLERAKLKHTSLEALRNAWFRYVVTVLQPLFPYVPDDAFHADGISAVTNEEAGATQPEALFEHLLEAMCFVHWFDRQHELVSQFNNVTMCSWSNMWFQWFAADERSVVECAAPPASGDGDGDGDFADAMRRFTARWATVYVDEAQDLNVADLSVLAHHYSNGAQVVLVGDRLQSLYGFRQCVNAFSDAVRAKVLFAPPSVTTTFQLSTSFRVPSNSIAFLKGALTDVNMTTVRSCAGSVVHVGFETAVPHILGDTFVLGATNLSVAYLAVAYLQHRPGVRIYCADTFYKRVKPPVAAEKAAYRKARVDTTKHDHYDDDDDDKCKEDDSAAYLHAKITEAFGAAALATLRTAVKTGVKPEEPYFSTVHSVKGLEAKNVVLTHDVTKPPYDPCVVYVAVTRAKQSVYLVTSQPSADDRESDDDCVKRQRRV